VTYLRHAWYQVMEFPLPVAVVGGLVHHQQVDPELHLGRGAVPVLLHSHQPGAFTPLELENPHVTSGETALPQSRPDQVAHQVRIALLRRRGAGLSSPRAWHFLLTSRHPHSMSGQMPEKAIAVAGSLLTAVTLVGAESLPSGRRG
jgi:hypothetical protein